MTQFEKIFTALVVDGQQKTAAQLAAQLGTTTNAVRARVSEIRDAGYAIYANKRTDTKGRVKRFYRHGAPTRSLIAAGRLFQKLSA